MSCSSTVADDSPAPGGGTVTAAATALAAALASMACRYAMRHQPDSVEFADMVSNWTPCDTKAPSCGQPTPSPIAASRVSREPTIRTAALAAAADNAADIPLRVAELAYELVRRGQRRTVSGNPNLRSDACIATLLAAAAVRGAATLVHENLRSRARILACRRLTH